MKDISDDPDFRAAFALLSGKTIQKGAMGVVVSESDTEAPDGLLALSPEHFRKVCRANCGPLTCRYLAHTVNGICCAKVLPAVKLQVDLRFEAKMMRSKGDNCPGRGGLIPASTRSNG